ncbi:hypothetical protein HANVADRAFT_30865 [Hanseniaspora valbyensis NRRL Y-1626]|uniref:Uncharacterized protein n=1 Tax=Hanseniaspora valbyensis NRRL Y-1626 TaxID=766949 RepID=A0A1B7TFV8_9ASCO|nr:hypothetical protein HANVADRAFT_30865 [Hanseniaspora valbyensis NRRL Y-1626]
MDFNNPDYKSQTNLSFINLHRNGFMDIFLLRARKLFLLQARTLIMIFLGVLLLQKIVSVLLLDILLAKIILPKKLKSFSIGLILFNFFARIRINLANGTDILVSKMKIQKKLIDDSAKKSLLIDLIDLSITMPQNTQPKKDKLKGDVEDKHNNTNNDEALLLSFLNKMENIEYNNLFKYKWILKIILFFIPIQLSLQKLRLKIGEKEFYADYISIRFTYNKVSKKCNLNFFVHEFNDYKNLTLKNFEFEIEGEWSIDYKSKVLKFNKYSSYLKVSNLDFTLPFLAPYCKHDYLEDLNNKKKNDEKMIEACKNKDLLFQKYGTVFTKVCSFLKVLDFKVEDINLKIPNYHADFYCASMTMRFSAIDSLKLETGYEFTFSSNTINLKIFEDKILSIPLLSVFLIGDSLYDFKSVEHFKSKIKCILSCIDCNIIIGEKHVEYFIQNFIKNKSPKLEQYTENTKFEKEKKDEKLSLLLYFFDYFSLDLKLLIPNASFTYLVDESNITIKNNQSVLHLKSPKNIYHLYDEFLGGSSYQYNEDLRLTKTLSSLKTSDVSIIFNDLVEKKYTSNTILALKKFEMQNYQNDIFQIDNLISGSELKLYDLTILKKLHNAVLRLGNIWSSYNIVKNTHVNTHKAKNNKTTDLILDKIHCRTRIIDSYFVNSFSNVIKKELDPSNELFDKFYGFQSFIKNIDFRFHKNSRIITVDSIDLGLIERSEFYNSSVSKAGRLEDILIDLSDGTDIILNSANFKTELATIWTGFYLTSAYKHIFPKSNHKPKTTGEKEKKEKKKLNIKINTILIDSYLVDDLNLLFSFKDISVERNLITIRLIQIFAESTYEASALEIDDNTGVFTRLLKVKDAVIDTRKENLLDEFLVLLNVKTFELRSEYHLKFYKIFDRVVSTFKSFKQLKTGLSDLDKFLHNQPTSVKPVSVPFVKAKVDKFLVKLDEDPFEHRLNLIYKIGLSEQRLRMDKEIMFQEELEKLATKKYMSQEDINDAKYRLYKNFSTSWIERVKTAKNEFLNVHAYDIIERKYLDRKVKIYAGHERIPLMVYSLMDMEFIVKPPSFGIDNYAKFVNEYGKGVPMDTVYTLLILLNVTLNLKMLKLQLRDYALPLMNFQNTILQGDLILGETMPDAYGTRQVWVPFIKGCNKDANNVFGSNIIRTINSVKFFMNLKVNIDSPQPTILTWGKSLQPAIQAVMMWFDFLTKPPLDPSPKIGFWDKIRLLTHGVIKFEWAENSELHLNMKGSTDPYDIHEFGAGLTFCWKGGTTLNIHENSNPADFLKIKSKSFILGIRNFDALYQEDKFSKILMELNGDVLWRLGLMFESGDIHKPGQTRRSSDFLSHYHVYLANPNLLNHVEGHDSYKKFRSDFIHMDIGVYSNDPTLSKNSVHLAPFCSEHFLAWWKLFSTYTSGPIRQGPLFPSMQQSSTKFGRSLFTLKYQMSFAPLEMAHVYRHSASENMNIDDSVFTGLKGKFDVFKLDLHQKRSPVTLNNDLLNRTKRVWKLKMDQGEIDFINADIRLIHSIFNKNSGANLLSEESDEFGWYDLLDYTYLDDFEGLSVKPEFMQTIPLLQSERISYFRNIERKVLAVNYPFGNESFHDCLAGKHNSELTQLQIYEDRLSELEKRILKLRRDSENHKSKIYKETLEYFMKQKEILKDLTDRFEPMRLKIKRTDTTTSLGSEDLEMINPIPTLLSKKDEELKYRRAGHKTTFDNKFVVHNMRLKLNDMSKQLLLAYAKKMEERKATSFYDSYTSLSIIKELLEYNEYDSKSNRFSNEAASNGNEKKLDYHVKFDSMDNSECIEKFEEIIRSIADVNFFSSDHMVLKFIMPQIQLCSNLVEDWATVLLADEIEVGIIDIIQGRDSALVVKSADNLRENRICMLLSEVKFFTLDKESVLSHPSLKYEVDFNKDLSQRGWIPWLPIESFIDSSCLEKFKIFAKSSMFLSFNNPNDLFYDKISHRIYNDDPILRIGIPEMHVQSTSEQYNAIYTIFDDLLTFDSKENKKWESLAKTFLADEMKKNFVTSAQFIINLQMKIRAIRLERSNMKDNDPQSFDDMRDLVEKELDSSRFELRLLMTSLKKNLSSNKKRSGNNELSRVMWYFSADDLIWDLYEEPNKPFITLGLGFSSFQRTTYSDGSTSNKLMIYTLHCFNLDKRSLYGELISPLKEYNKTPAPLLELLWKMGKPVGGISQIDTIDVNLKALRVQLEHKILEKIISFLLGNGVKNSATDDKTNGITSPRKSTESRISLDGKTIKLPIEGTKNSIEKEKDTYFENSLITPEHGISEMVKRSNKYMAIKKIVINRTILCVSYRGTSKITNLNDLVLKTPVLRYENKIWSNQDFIAALKRDLVKIVLSHTGNIIGNKFKTKKKMESKYESFKQFSKLLRADSAVGRNRGVPGSIPKEEPQKRKTSANGMTSIEEGDAEEETESIEEFK